MMSGKINMSDFERLFQEQIAFQERIVCEPIDEDQKTLPYDSVYWFKYHCLAMFEELGEVLKSDKRWKTHRNTRYEPEEKLDELSDVLITYMNMCIFSGYSAEQVIDSTFKKIAENHERINLKKAEKEVEGQN